MLEVLTLWILTYWSDKRKPFKHIIIIVIFHNNLHSMITNDERQAYSNSDIFWVHLHLNHSSNQQHLLWLCDVVHCTCPERPTIYTIHWQCLWAKHICQWDCIGDKLIKNRMERRIDDMRVGFVPKYLIWEMWSIVAVQINILRFGVYYSAIVRGPCINWVWYGIVYTMEHFGNK